MILASITRPQFRLWWLDDLKKASAHCLLYEMPRTVMVALDCSEDEPPPLPRWWILHFHGIIWAKRISEVDSYLSVSDPAKDFSVTHKYVRSVKLFLKFNTSLPSSAPVECLFSRGDRHLYRGITDDVHFEQQLLLPSCFSLVKLRKLIFELFEWRWEINMYMIMHLPQNLYNFLTLWSC